jgi:TetR/AcrR family transcriptional regulator, transcriptional repressor for nem operon
MVFSEMTDSVAADRGGKRERLVASAGDLLHRHGMAGTTIADVAAAAGVPPGNVYYYFKTKDDLLRAVIAARVDQVRAMLATFDRRRDPAARLKALAHNWVQMRDLVARHGCPLGSLAAELDRRDDGLDREAAQPLDLILTWAQEQFRQLGRPDPRDLAITLLARVQGAAGLANAFRDPQLLTDQIRLLDHWIDAQPTE